MNIIDIAKIAGVSTATVSRVINHSGKVKEETRERIQEVIDEYNYVPNAIARSLCMKDRFSIGVILPDIKNEFFSDVIQGITEITEQSIYNILFFNTDERNEVEHDYLKVVASERLKGLLISPVSDHDEVTAAEFAERMRAKGVYVVAFSYPVVPKGKARIRTQVCASHTKEDIDFIVKCFKEVREEMGE